MDSYILRHIFGGILEKALEIIDSDLIKLYTSVSRTREFLEAVGKNGVVYKFFPNINYCPCQSFKVDVLGKKSQPTCKHVLAARLAQLLGQLTEEVISDDTFNYLILEVVKQIDGAVEK